MVDIVLVIDNEADCNNVPPVDAEYQSMVWLAPGVADTVMEPAPQRAFGTDTAADGTALIVAATVDLVTETQPVAVILD